MSEETKDLYLAHLAEIEKTVGHNGQAWTLPLRRAAMARFTALGFPTTRLEEWKYTNVAPLARIPFQPALQATQRLTSEALAIATIPDLLCTQLVFINGHYSPELSTLRPLPPNVQIGSLAAALSSHATWLQPHLGQHATYEEHAFIALNTALMQDGAYIYLPRGVVLEEPIHVIFITIPRGEAKVSYPRNLFVMEDDTQASIIESYHGLGDEAYFTNAVTELVLGNNSRVDHCKLEWESQTAFHIATLQIEQERSSHCATHAITLGGALVRNDINVVLAGEGSETTLNGLFMATGQQRVDHHTRIDHVKPHCTSRELYKGILAGKGRGVFNGKIIVHKDAQLSDAMQTNKNLLLSEDASIDTKPQLEILNNDVKCSHGSTIGRLDENSLFYLRTRGLNQEAARGLLTYAFASEIVNRLKQESTRTKLNKALLDWLPHGQSLKEAP
jgi:Fe-S cluster assembly protein SufD